MENEDFLDERTRVEHASQALWDAFLDGGGISALLEMCATFLRCPVLFKGDEVCTFLPSDVPPLAVSDLRRLFHWVECGRKPVRSAGG